MYCAPCNTCVKLVGSGIDRNSVTIDLEIWAQYWHAEVSSTIKKGSGRRTVQQPISVCRRSTAGRTSLRVPGRPLRRRYAPILTPVDISDYVPLFSSLRASMDHNPSASIPTR